MKIFVGSTNPVKINSVIQAGSETWPDLVAEGFDVPSGVNEQPRSDEETRQGAINRARAVLEIAREKNITQDFLGVGLEGGIFKDSEDQMWSTVWAAVIDLEENIFLNNGARFHVPQAVADVIEKGGEMGPAMNRLLKSKNIKQKQGMIGIITEGFVDRTEEYTGIIKMALGLWYGRNWQDRLK